MTQKKEQLLENAVYALVWGLLFLAPVLTLYIRTATDSSLAFDWSEAGMVWRQFGVFFAAFLVHNYLLAPLLVYRQHRLQYFTMVSLLVAAFALYQCQGRPHKMRHRPPTHMAGRPAPPDFGDMPPMAEGHGPAGGNRPELRDRGTGRPPMMMGQHDIMNIVALVLMMAANLGIKLYFRQRRDQQQMAELQHRTLEQQLEYLKYQLNPHFLMNTLNNIHALVDIDPERSKEAIIQLSKILRYVLYESNHERVPMARETEFMDNYIRLMRMRYSDKLQFSVSMPDDDTGITVPPLLFISFVENAFKHGVSYREPSFITINGKRIQDSQDQQRLVWTCRNSKHSKPDTDDTPRQGGVGLANVRQRLDLIFGSDYTLTVNDADDVYEVVLDIPL